MVATKLFATIGGKLDRGYLNLRAANSPAERDIVEELEAMWAQYEPYADHRFVKKFALDPEAHFWEMFIGCALLGAGKSLLPTVERPRKSGFPDLCVLNGKRCIWIEAIAPDRGESGEDQIPEIRPLNEGGSVQHQPIRQIQLRITSALLKKRDALKQYIKKGIIATSDVCIIGIGGARFGIYAQGAGFPLALSAVFPIGNQFVRIDRDSFAIVESGFLRSLTIKRTSGPDIPRTAFMDPAFRHVSGVIWSRVNIGNTSRKMRPLSFIHNPSSANQMPQRWGVWDREFVATQSGDAWTAFDILAVPEETPGTVPDLWTASMPSKGSSF